MRLAVVADIHGNLPALEAVLGACRRAGIDCYVVAGDIVGYGPFPNECVEAIASLEECCVALGNHDLMALGLLDSARCIPLARRSIEWTQTVLRPDVRQFLGGLPLRCEVEGIVVAHGTLDDPEEYTADTSAALRQLAQLTREYPGARLLVLGHTHRPLLCLPGGPSITPRNAARFPLGSEPALVNPGAVGQSREFRLHARFAILDLESRYAEFFTIGYDPRPLRAEARRQQIGTRAYHLPPSPIRRAQRVARQFVARVARPS